jgi:hypothetical protein
MSTMRFLFACALISLLGFAGCSSRATLPLPPIRPALGEVASLRIFVINASNEAAAAAGETTVSGYGIYMRGAVQRSLTRAGFTVVVSPTDPTDLLAKVDIENPSLYQSGTASMTLATPDGVVIEQVSGIISLDENVDIDERGPVALVEKAARSPRIEAFAKGRRRGECEKMMIPGRKVLEVPAEGN